jgi:predicted dehydrogenase
MKKLRVGFLSTVGIAKKNWAAILHSGNCVVTAVASRDLDRSRAFIADCQGRHPFETAPVALGSYDDLLTSPDVDAVYVPLPTGLRRELVIRAAERGKHVLCEKPCAPGVADLEAMLAACRRHSVQFLDGVMFMHNPRLARLREILDDRRSIGPVRRIASAFTFSGNEDFFRNNIRINGGLEPFGCLGDLGWYCIRFALWTLDWQLPEGVIGRVLSESENLPGWPGAPIEFAATLFYPGGVTVEFYSSFRAALQQWAHVSGPLGWLRVPDFVIPPNPGESVIEVNNQTTTVTDGAQEIRMWRHFGEQIATGKLNDQWPQWAMQTQRVLDACLQSARHRSAMTAVTPYAGSHSALV